MGRRLHNLQTYPFAPGEGDEGDSGVADQAGAYRSVAGQVVERAFRRPGGVEDLHQPGRRDGRALRGLEDDGVARDQGRGDHPGRDGHGEVPRRDDDGHPAGLVAVLVLFSREPAQALGPVEADHLAGVVLAKVDRFGNIGVGLGPGLGDFVDGQGGELTST